MSDFTRRTVVRGTAWTVPVIAVAANAPAFATSPPPPPPPPMVGINDSCANVGAEKKGCGVEGGIAKKSSDDNTLQVPVKVVNTSSAAIVFQVTDMFTTNNQASAPTGPGDGVTSGIRGIVATTSTFSEGTCTTATKSTCTGGLPGGSVEIAANTTAYFFIISASAGSASNFQATIKSRLLTTPGCVPIPGTTATTSTSQAISSNNCR